MKTFLVIVDPGTCSRMEQHIFVVKARDSKSAYNKFWKKGINQDGVTSTFESVFIYNDPDDGSPPYTQKDFSIPYPKEGNITTYYQPSFGTISISVVELDDSREDDCYLLIKSGRYN